MKDYTEWSYLWPPRPELAAPTDLLGYYERSRWVAQFKMNGTCNVMGIAPDRKDVRAMSRHNDEHKLWTPSEHTAAPFADLKGDGWYVFTAELMHSKVPGIRDINYIHDILVADGETLFGMSFDFRQDILAEIFGKKVIGETKSHFVIDEHTWWAKNHTEDYEGLFEGITEPHIEGLVFKNRYSVLAPCYKQSANAAWSAKTRKATKNYAF